MKWIDEMIKSDFLSTLNFVVKSCLSAKKTYSGADTMPSFVVMVFLRLKDQILLR